MKRKDSDDDDGGGIEEKGKKVEGMGMGILFIFFCKLSIING